MPSQLARSISATGLRIAKIPGVVDKDVEAAEPLDGSLAHPHDGGAVAEVGDGGKGAASRRLDRIDCRPGSLFAARVNRHVRALAREGLGDGGADAACRPGDKGAAAAKRSLHYRLPVMPHGGVGRRPTRSARVASRWGIDRRIAL